MEVENGLTIRRIEVLDGWFYQVAIDSVGSTQVRYYHPPVFVPVVPK